MAHMPKELEAFGEQVAKILNRYFPDEQAVFSGPLEFTLGEKHFDVEDLRRIVSLNPNIGVEIAEQYICNAMQSHESENLPLPWSVAKERVLPQIKHASALKNMNPEMVAHVEFVNDTVIVFFIDLPHSSSSVETEQLLRWGVSIDDLDKAARENLADKSVGVNVSMFSTDGGGHGAVISAKDGYDAARLLMNGLHRSFSEGLNGDFLVSIPTQNCFVATSIGPSDYVGRIRKQMTGYYRKLPFHITDKQFLVTRDGIAAYVDH